MHKNMKFYLCLELPSMGTGESTSLPNIACAAPCNSAMAFSNVITKVSQNIDKNEERAQESEMKDKFSVEWKRVQNLSYMFNICKKLVPLLCLEKVMNRNVNQFLENRFPLSLIVCSFGYSFF